MTTLKFPRKMNSRIFSQKRLSIRCINDIRRSLISNKAFPFSVIEIKSHDKIIAEINKQINLENADNPMKQ